MLASDTDEGGSVSEEEDRDESEEPAVAARSSEGDTGVALMNDSATAASAQQCEERADDADSDSGCLTLQPLDESKHGGGADEPAVAAGERSSSSDSDDSVVMTGDRDTSVVAKQCKERADDTDSDSEFAALQASMSQLLDETTEEPGIEGSMPDDRDGIEELVLTARPLAAAAAAKAVAMAAVQKAQEDARAFLIATGATCATGAESDVIGGDIQQQEVAFVTNPSVSHGSSDDGDFDSLQALMELVCADDVSDATHPAPSPSIQSESNLDEQLRAVDCDAVAETTSRRFYAAQETPFREVIVDILPLGITVGYGEDVTFIHLLTMLSWQVHRTSAGQAIGFCLKTADQDTHTVFLTQDGPEICELLYFHAQNFTATTNILPDRAREKLQLVPAMQSLTVESVAEDLALLEMEMDGRNNSRVAEVQAAAEMELAQQRVELQSQVGMMEFSIKAALAEASATEESLQMEVEALEDQVSEEAQRRQKAEQERDARVKLAEQQQAALQAELEAWAQVEAGCLARAQMDATMRQETTAAQIAAAEAAAMEFDRVTRESPPARKKVSSGLADYVLAGDIDVSGTWSTSGAHGGIAVENLFVLKQDETPRMPPTVKELQALLLEIENAEDVLRVVTCSGVLPAAVEWARGQAHTRNAALQLMAAHLSRNPPPTFTGHCDEHRDEEEEGPGFHILNGMVLRSASGTPSVCFTQHYEEDDWSTGGDVFWAANLCFSNNELGLTEGRWAGMGLNGGSWSGNRMPLEWPEEWNGCLNNARTALDLENWGFADAELSQVATMLPRLRNLQSINLSGNEITNVGPLAEVLPALPRLTKLLLTVNLIVDIAPLVAVLPRLPALKQLLLDGNMISNVGNLHLVLPKLHNLQMLDLSDNRIGIQARDMIETAFRGTNVFLEPQMVRGTAPTPEGMDVPEAKGHSGSEASAMCSPMKAAPIDRPRLGQKLQFIPSNNTSLANDSADVSTPDAAQQMSVDQRMSFWETLSDREPVSDATSGADSDANLSPIKERTVTVEEGVPVVTENPSRTSQQQHKAHMLQHLEDCVVRQRIEDSELKQHLGRHEAALMATVALPSLILPEAECHSGNDRHAVATPRKAAPLHRPRRRATSSPQARLLGVVVASTSR